VNTREATGLEIMLEAAVGLCVCLRNGVTRYVTESSINNAVRTCLAASPGGGAGTKRLSQGDRCTLARCWWSGQWWKTWDEAKHRSGTQAANNACSIISWEKTCLLMQVQGQGQGFPPLISILVVICEGRLGAKSQPYLFVQFI